MSNVDNALNEVDLDFIEEVEGVVNESGIPETKPEETEQVKDEQDMAHHKGSSSDEKNKKPKKNSDNPFDKMKGTIAQLNAKNAEQAKRWQKRLANTPAVELGDESITLEYSLQVQQNTYKDIQPLFHGRIATVLGPVLDPLVRVINGGLAAQDLRNLAALHVTDADGNPIKNEPLKDNKGDALFRTNSIDDLRYAWKAISNNDACMKALEAFYEACEAIDFSKAPASTTMKAHRSEFTADTDIQPADGGYKKLTEPKSVTKLRVANRQTRKGPSGPNGIENP